MIDIRKTARELAKWFNDEETGGLYLIFDGWRNRMQRPIGWMFGGCFIAAICLENYFCRFLPKELVERVGFFYELYELDEDGSQEWSCVHAMVRISGSPRGDYYVDARGAWQEKELRKDFATQHYRKYKWGRFKILSLADLEAHPKHIFSKGTWDEDPQHSLGVGGDDYYIWKGVYKFQIKDVMRGIKSIKPIMK